MHIEMGNQLGMLTTQQSVEVSGLLLVGSPVGPTRRYKVAGIRHVAYGNCDQPWDQLQVPRSRPALMVRMGCGSA